MVDDAVHDSFLGEEAAVHEEIAEEESCQAEELEGSDLVERLHLSAALLADVEGYLLCGLIVKALARISGLELILDSLVTGGEV
jgi:hypothetical protein